MTTAPNARGGAAAARPRRTLLLAAYAAVYVIWGSTYLAIRVGIDTLPPFGMGATRFLAAGALLYAWARWRGAPRPTRAEWAAAAVVGALLLLVGNGAVTWAEQRVASGVAALLIATEPLWIVLLGWARPDGARPGRATVAGLALGLAGVAVLVAPAGAAGGGAPNAHVDLLGAAVVVLGALSWAVGSVWSGRRRLPASAPLASGMQMLAGGAMFAAVSAAVGEPARFDPAAVSAASAGAVAYLVVFGSLVAFSAYAWLLTVEPPTRVATYAFVNPAVAVLLGWAAGGEPLTARIAVAGLVIVGAVVLLTRNPPAAAAPAASRGAGGARDAAAERDAAERAAA